MKNPSRELLKKLVQQLNAETPDVEFALGVVNKKIGGYGVESFEDNNGEWVSYVNMGDTYDTTIFHDEADGEFHVGSWGDLVESDDERFAEEE
jgi:hypothetical protein